MRVVIAALLALLIGCEPNEKPPKCPPPPPPPEPEHQVVVVGTIGKLHLAESRYPLAKLAETMAVFKPDLVLVEARVDSMREDKLEDASFEMTYVTWLAKTRGVAVEPIDWFREADWGKPPPPVEPSDEVEIERRETDVLRLPKMYTFEQANSAELSERILLANDSAMRHRSGDAPNAQRRAWIQHLAADAAMRHGKPKKVLAFVDVLDRPSVEAVLGGVGYTPRTAAEVLAKSKESLAGGDLPSTLITTWRAEAERAHANAAKASAPNIADFWNERAHTFDIAVDRKGACCVTESALRPVQTPALGNP